MNNGGKHPVRGALNGGGKIREEAAWTKKSTKKKGEKGTKGENISYRKTMFRTLEASQ